MYVSPAVRTIRDDPVEGESVTLLLEVADDAAVDDVAAAAEAAGATVEEELQFRTLETTVGHERVGAVCAVEGIAHVETGNTLGIDPDGAEGAGEDVRPDG
ncbi:hypothetical protein I7X12_12180 [Halosimplex litoreum]|uniref:Putative peptidase inhibitor domain-containing protein n=1 Tax=Halosimplex litoreum TaxID=1198301 RepID=A0A7T3KTZ6_9EURY|nr:hypothetical protein [Halosimplex litoreum]QPV61524.1 hypothetical protein I7X12_12180 [Halosimplex litoreum]